MTKNFKEFCKYDIDASIYTFIGDSFEIGEVVAWIFNNEMGGYRMK